MKLIKLFSNPETKELGVDLHSNGRYYESVGQVFEINIDEIPETDDRSIPGGKSLILFDKNDIKKLLETNVGAVELILTKEGKLLIVNHCLYDTIEEPE